MGKPNHSNRLQRQRTSRSLLAISLAASLAAFGCTTNHNLGNGTPTRTPEVRTAPTSGVTSGGETNTPPSNPPMTSSYTRSEVLPSVTMRSGVIRRSPDAAAAIMAGHQAVRGRYLGVVSPGAAGQPYASDNIRTFVPPAMVTNPQLTINSSISSQPVPGISSGAEGLFTAGGADVTVGTTAAATVAGDLSPTTAAAGVPVGAIAGTAPLPTMASARTPGVTAASVGLGRSATRGATSASSARTTAATRGGSVTAPVRILRGTNGNVTVTNVGTTPLTMGRNP